MHRSETVEARHLVKRGKVYFVVLDVPKPLHPTLEKEGPDPHHWYRRYPASPRAQGHDPCGVQGTHCPRQGTMSSWLGGAATFDWLAQQADKAEAKAAELTA